LWWLYDDHSCCDGCGNSNVVAFLYCFVLVVVVVVGL
jgi:hypothetical protein